MPIQLLTVCEWVGPRVQQVEYREPSWELVEDAIRNLNGRERNDLYLCPAVSDPETYLCVGGEAGRYLVTGSVRGESFPTVVGGPGGDGARETLVVGGQAGDYPQHWVVDLDTALRAARAFYDSGEFGGGGVQWVEV